MKPLSLCALTLALGVPLYAAPAKKTGPKTRYQTGGQIQNPPPSPSPKPPVKPPGVAAPTPAPVVETGPKTWALLVGVSKYQLSQISPLHYPAIDAMGLRDTLTDPKVGGVPTSRTLLLTDENATRAKIMGAVDSFLRPNVQEGDKVIVFLAGHGIVKGAGLDAKSYLLPNDVKGLTTAALDNTAVPLEALKENLATLPASQFTVFIDACREDPTPGRGITPNALSNVLARGISFTPSRSDSEAAFFFACDVGQRAYEDEKYGHGVFTKWIIDGIKGGDLAEKPSGAIDLGRLSTYVGKNVDAWAKNITQSGNFEVNQTPKLVTFTNKPIVVINRKSDLSDTLIEPSKPRFVVDAPEGALVKINGEKVGVGTVEKVVPSEGDYTVTVTKPGYAPVSRSVTALGGYEHQIEVQMEPSGENAAGTTGNAAPATSSAATLYKNAIDALTREQWEVADQGFAAAEAADPKFAAAYESGYDLHVLQNRNTNALADALGYMNAMPKSARSLAFVSRAYSQFAVKGPGKSVTMKVPTVGTYGAPKDQMEAAKLAVKAAREALAQGASANTAEVQLALGYALTAQATGDKNAKDKDKDKEQNKNKKEAIDAFSSAVVLDASDAANQLGYGYGIRAFAAQIKDEDKQKSELGRALTSLNQALVLRPDYYEAHRELAYCYVMLDNTEEALKECNLARACRGSAGDANEVAGIEVTISGLHQKIAENSTGEEKTAHEEASKGYLEEAQETSKTEDLKAVLSILNAAGVSTSLSSFLPAKFLPFLDIKGTIRGKINGEIGKKLPGGGKNSGFQDSRVVDIL